MTEQLSPTLRTELARIETTVITAEFAARPAERYLGAHLAIGQYAALLLAATPTTKRDTSSAGGGRRGRRNVWQLVGEIAPELAEWCGYFAALQGKREVVTAGASTLVSEREADDLIRDARTFGELVVRRLRRPPHRVRPRVDLNYPDAVAKVAL